MKKNILLVISMFLIVAMFLSILYAAFASKKGKETAGQDNKDLKQNLQINIGAEPPSLHPGLADDPVSEIVILQTFEGLTQKDLWGNNVNAAAKVIKISDDQKTYTFTLRDAKWSNGDPVTAKDFEYAWKWALDPNNHSPNAYKFFNIEGAQAFNEGKGGANQVGIKSLDEKTLVVKLENPTSAFFDLISSPAYFPINSKVAKENPNWANEAGDHYPTNGPFILADWSHNQKITLKKNNTYWDANSVKLKNISMSMVNDSSREFSLYKNGELDWAGAPTTKLQADNLAAKLKDKMQQNKSVSGSYFFQINTRVEPLNNANIRKALALAIDRKSLLDNPAVKQVQAMTIVPSAVIPDNKIGYFKDNDVAKAKQYLQKGLKEQGYKDIAKMPPISLTFTSNEENQKVVQAIRDMWKGNLGIEVTLKPTDWKTTINNIQTHNYQVVQMDRLTDSKDPINFLEMYSKNDADNGTGWQNKEYTSLLKQSQNELDDNKRQKLLKNAEAVLMEEMPIIPIYFYSYNWLQNKNLTNVAISDSGQLKFKWAQFVSHNIKK